MIKKKERKKKEEKEEQQQQNLNIHMQFSRLWEGLMELLGYILS